MNRRQTVFAAAAAGIVAVGALVVLVTRDDAGPDGPSYQPQIREALLDDVQPDPACPDAAAGPELGDGQVPVNVVRVVDSCLAYSSEAVDAAEVDDRLHELRADSDVVAADEAVERRLLGAGQDEPEQWALAPEHLDGEDVRNLWPVDAPEVRVAVLDSGIDPAHLDLTGQIVERAPWAQLDQGEGDHGTKVAGIAAAVDDGAGVVGLTPAARLMDVQYKAKTDDGDRWAGPSEDMGEYIRWAVDHGADVINMSFGDGEPSDTEMTAVLYAELRGVVLVAGAGNCGMRGEWRIEDCGRHNEVYYPAAYAPVLSVANHNRDGERSSTSSANASVDIAAPGDDIRTTCPAEGDDTRPTCSTDGTSMAAPFVSATAAMLLARHPDATPEAIREAIVRSARTDDRQPLGSRTDEFGWGLLDPEAAAEYLDEHPGAPQEKGSSPADRTAAAFVDADTHELFALDDGIPHPVRAIADEDTVLSVDWSGDHTLLVGAVEGVVFSWSGPGSTPVEAPCEMCDMAYLERPDGDLVASLDDHGTITTYDVETLEPSGSATIPLPAPEEGFVHYGDVGGNLLIAHSNSAEAGAPDTLWLVDPVTGEALASHRGEEGTGVSTVAVDAEGGRVAYVGHRPGGVCGDTTDEVFLLDPGDLGEVSATAMPTSDLGELEADDLFFNGDAVYAVMDASTPDGDSCTNVGSGGLWRLDADAGTWEQVDDGTVLTVRPIEGLTGDPGTGKLAVDDEGNVGTFEPTGAPGSEHVQLGEVSGVLWATPTREEVDLARSSSTPPVEEEEEGGGEPAANSMEAAIARFEAYLHALGEGDIGTICEIAGPAAQVAEDEGFGPCESTYATVLDMISPEQAVALKTAHVNLALIESTGPGRIHIPVEAVTADVTFTESDLGSYTIAYQDGDWFIVD